MRTFTLKELSPGFLIKSNLQIELPDKAIPFKIKIAEYYLNQCAGSPAKALKLFSNLGRTQLFKYTKSKFALSFDQENELKRMILNPIVLRLFRLGKDSGDRLHVVYMDLEDAGVTPIQVEILDVKEISQVRRKVIEEKNKRDEETTTDEFEILQLAKQICSRAASGVETLEESCISYGVTPEMFNEWLYKYEDVRQMYGESVSIMAWIVANVGRAAVLQKLAKHITTGKRTTTSTRYKRKLLRSGSFGFVEDSKVETIEELDPDKLFALYLSLRAESDKSSQKLGINYSNMDMDRIEEQVMKALKEKGKI
jgi:hypothetical protein